MTDLVIKYYRQKGYRIEKDIVLEGFSGLSHKFDIVIRKGREKHAILIKEWSRTVGVNMVINLDKASEDVGFSNPIMVSEKFSGHAKAYANRRGLTLLTKRAIMWRLE
ncbi:MAG: restriction endonuclease [Candidatus Bathyarchaeota archaeon]|nr:MAG: restriction endonuclease [Candidatus Bathyarchaeota archaeon]